MKTIELNFGGYWIDKENLPNYQGVYLVYRGVYNEKTDKVSIKELLYIGQAENICERHSTHEKQTQFEESLKTGEILCYAATKVSSSDLSRVEGGLIYKCQPPLNDKCTQSFNHAGTLFKVSGRCWGIPTEFTIDE